MSLITLPVTLVNNTVADATDVMSNFNTIVNELNGLLTTANFAATLTFADNDYVDLSAVTHNDTAVQGFRLPQIGASPSSPSTGEGFLGWDQTNNTLEIYDGATWTVVAGGVTGMAVPALTLGTANAAGSATTVVRTDATILAFDATIPAAIGSAGATGSATVAARRDHVHAGQPAWQFVETLSWANPSTGPITSATLPTDSDLFMVVFEHVLGSVGQGVTMDQINSHLSIRTATLTDTADGVIAEWGQTTAKAINGYIIVPRLAADSLVLCPANLSYQTAGGVNSICLLARDTGASDRTAFSFSSAGNFTTGKIHIYKSVPS